MTRYSQIGAQPVGAIAQGDGSTRSEFIWNDLTDPGPIRMMDYWTRFSKSGVNGDPTLAAAEKGRVIFESVVRNFVRLAREFKNRLDGERVDYHRTEWRG